MPEWSFSQRGPAGGRLVVAHRGASSTYPENTLEAFEAAIAAGADAVEWDVRLSADGIPVVMHDATVERTTDGVGAVADMTAAELGSLRIGPGGDGGDGGLGGVPTLEEALATCAGRAGAVVELKVDDLHTGEEVERGAMGADAPPSFGALADAVVDAIARAEAATWALAISFSPRVLAAVRERAPALETGLLTMPDVTLEEGVRRASDSGHRWILPFVLSAVRGGADGVQRARGAGIRTAVWVVDDPGVAVSLWDAGVEAIATNDPAALVAARDATGGPR